jgi:hypothetical protein
MTCEDQASRLLSNAKGRVSKAAAQWNAVSLPLIEECTRSLEHSASDLTEVVRLIKDARIEAPGDIRSAVSDLKKAASRLERLVDASAAFWRLAPGSNANEPLVYESNGAFRPNTGAPESQGMQG